MDTKKDSAVSDVPTFKVARVGNDRKRKGGGLSFLRGGGARGVWSGASGGAGAAAGVDAVTLAGFTFSRFAAIFLVSVLGLGAAGLGSMLGRSGEGKSLEKPKAFARDKNPVQLEGDTSNLPATANSIPNSMGYISGSMDGLTPEERAKKAVDAAAAAEAQRIADEEAAKKAEKDRLAGNPAVDPNALLASAKADGGPAKGGSSLGKKFGALSSSMGSGSSLSGGAGMSGGMNRQFASSGGASKGASGQLTAMKGGAHPSSARVSNSKQALGRTKGFARKQLVGANAFSRRGAAAGRGETAAADAGSAFDNNTAGGTAISGPGVGKGGGPKTDGGGGANPGNGSPTGSGPSGGTGCGVDKKVGSDGVTCEDIYVPAGTDAKPMLTMMCQLAMGLLAAIAVISVIKAALDGSFVAAGYGAALGTLIGAMGAIIALLGIAAIAMGDYAQGTVFTLTGGFIAAVAFIPGASSILTSGTMVIASAAGLVLGQAGKMLDKGNHKDKAPAAAQQ